MYGIAWLLCCDLAVQLTIGEASAYENVALHKTAQQQYPFSNGYWGANKAVDGKYSIRSADGGQCTISDNQKQTATWWVDLGDVLSIHHIKIYHRTDDLTWDANNGHPPRFLGFSVYISNTTNKDDGILCFKDTNYTRATIPDNVTIECVKHGRYVIYYNERLPGVTYPDGYSQYAYNELCELEVYGCPNSMVYRNNCNLSCPRNCKEGLCNIESGTCLGCNKGFKGLRCEEQCDGRTYGENCGMFCGPCLNLEQCHQVNGTCFKGCDKGFYGEWCTKGCIDGFYGYNCEDTCNINCGVPGKCDRVTGECEGGCQAGWKDLKCDQKCDGGRFGQNCAQSCGVCLDKEQCHHIKGICPNGCDRGYLGVNCTQECLQGFHGYQCNETCSATCLNMSCNAVTGACPVVSSPDLNTFLIIGGAAVVTFVSLVVVDTLCFVFRRKSTSRIDKEQNHSEKRGEQFSLGNTTPNDGIYDRISENRQYQELGPKTDGYDNGGYQGVGPRKEINGKTKDNKEYQELGQMSQPSHYDSLH
ncbi:multiple epidermal growth factor-like domains protein 10 [Saccostrea cucullata]|uniref:multiple epidermal growth factor-like domains protein 10 n=1 Tax=Saccostrea cuccullata TaxID=36930 RepID=UPI002ED63257